MKTKIIKRAQLKFWTLCGLLLPLVASAISSYPVHFTQMTGTDFDYGSNTMYKPTENSWTDATAFSTNEITTETTATIDYRIQGPVDTKAFGWASS